MSFALIVPLILIVECCSWYAVITTNYLGNAIENSLLGGCIPAYCGCAAAIADVNFTGSPGWRWKGWSPAFWVIWPSSVTIDVPMYLGRWQADLTNEKIFWAFSQACTISARAGRSPTTSSISAAKRSPGCRSISALRCGRAWRFAASISAKHQLYRCRRGVTLNLRLRVGHCWPASAPFPVCVHAFRIHSDTNFGNKGALATL